MLLESADRLRHKPLERLGARLVDRGLTRPAAEIARTNTRRLQLGECKPSHAFRGCQADRTLGAKHVELKPYSS